MKHKLSITLLLLGMFLLTQFIGLYVANAYAPTYQETLNETTNEVYIQKINQDLPFGLEPNEDNTPTLFSLLFSFALAIGLVFLLIKNNWKIILRAWFFFVIILALGITFNAFLKDHIAYAAILSFALALPLSYIKIFKNNTYIHNITELLIYPGIAAVFLTLVTRPKWIIIILIVISVYDMWAVWRSGVMQKMAKYQMEELHIFGGFLVPSMSKKVREEIKRLKQKYKNKKIPKKLQHKKFKVSFAILGGGDVIFPIITAGVFMRHYQSIVPALFVIAGAFIGLGILFAISKKKAYPAMPYITAGIFASLLIWWNFFLI